MPGAPSATAMCDPASAVSRELGKPAVRRQRTLPHAAGVALDVIATMGSRVVPMHEFELRMHQRGCDAQSVRGAIAALERRGWVQRSPLALHMSDAGLAAAAKGPSTKQNKAAPSRRLRMPPGLFDR